MTKEDLYTPSCIRTFTGVYVNVFDPKPEMFRIEDIAHSLSMQCRFGGHLKHFYSVANHSINCCYSVNTTLQLQALLHDASEAYLLDLPKPIKDRIPGYQELEDNLMHMIAEVFGFSYPLSPEVKQIDKYLLEREWESLMLGGMGNFNVFEDTVEIEFLKLFDRLT